MKKTKKVYCDNCEAELNNEYARKEFENKYLREKRFCNVDCAEVYLEQKTSYFEDIKN